MIEKLNIDDETLSKLSKDLIKLPISIFKSGFKTNDSEYFKSQVELRGWR